MVAESNGIELSKEKAEQAIHPVFINLPPHPDDDIKEFARLLVKPFH